MIPGTRVRITRGPHEGRSGIVTDAPTGDDTVQVDLGPGFVWLEPSALAPLSSGPSPNDPINHPAHYTSSAAKCSSCGQRIECIDVTESMPFTLGNAVKYLWRAGLKGSAVEDLKKARWYLDREIQRREKGA